MLLTTAASLVLALSPDPERHLAAALQPAPETELTHGPDASLQLETCLKGHDKAWCLERHPQEQSVQRQRAPGPAGAGAASPPETRTEGPTKRVFLLGDSHALNLVPSLTAAVRGPAPLRSSSPPLPSLRPLSRATCPRQCPCL